MPIMLERLIGEAPPHYKSHYLNYEGLERLIDKLLSIKACLEHGEPLRPNVPGALLNQFVHQVQLLNAMPSIKPELVLQLVIQAMFHECLKEEIHALNQFVALQYSTIREGISAVFRRLREISDHDLEYRKAEDTKANQSQISSQGSQKAMKDACLQPESRIQASNLSHDLGPQNGGVEMGESSSSLSGFLKVHSEAPDPNSEAKGTATEPETSSSDPCISNDGTHPRSTSSDTNSQLSDSDASLEDTSAEDETLSAYEQKRAASLEECEVALSIQAAILLHLDHYIRINYQRVMQLAALHDQKVEGHIVPWIAASLSKELFASVDLDRLLIFISVGWSKFRAVQTRQKTESSEAWVPPESFVRRTTKYWIPLHNVVKLKLMILRYMPYLIFGATLDELEAYVDPYVMSANPMKKIDEGQLITSIYLDSTDGFCYDRRIRRLDRAELIRFRWYGHNNNEPDKQIYIEKKTHREAWVGQASTKERFTLPQFLIRPYMTQQLSIEQIVELLKSQRNPPKSDKAYTQMLTLGKVIQDLISEHQLKPLIRTSYQRSAFQLPTSNEVRFSIDTNLCMVDEYVPPGMASAAPKAERSPYWCRLGDEILGKDEVVRFPYAILEVKLQISEQPPWVTHILEATDAILVYKFSKFQHGMALLHPEMIQHHSLPHWISDFHDTVNGDEEPLPAAGWPLKPYEEKASRPLPSFFSRLMQALFSKEALLLDLPESQRQSLLSQTTPGPSSSDCSALLQRLPAVPVVPVNETEQPLSAHEMNLLTLEWAQAVRTSGDHQRFWARCRNVRKLDPKSCFACERTFLHYVNKSLILSVLAILLTSRESPGFARKCGGCFVGVVSVVLIWFSYVVFDLRAARIANRRTNVTPPFQQRLDSVHGPVVIFAMTFFSLILAGLLGSIPRPPS